MAWFLLSWPWLVYYFGMDLSEFDGLEPVSEHELKTLIQHLPDGALGLFERRLILRVLELEEELTLDETEYDDRAQRHLDSMEWG